ncbi:nuclear transport factor 2 family protein [Herbaspirillum sp. SJZ107]|uniref:nuclear transport factor 2 family protein n=1 Tax=Herbaspirillum sp. SJZ107 TaxID=2572881 RepID=UPI002107BA72|nr:nuclear transport factor 2 family protein [Herbaspirillum sp. SJZ107]
MKLRPYNHFVCSCADGEHGDGTPNIVMASCLSLAFLATSPGTSMSTNEEIIRELYAVAEGASLNLERFVALFAEDGYFLDMSSGQKWTGAEVRQPLEGLASTFPDFHRELLKVYSAADGVIIVELRLQGTHAGDFPIPGGVLRATGKRFDVPCCDVFVMEGGKVKAFHCYNMRSVWLEQLGAGKG